jgi:hypothetical protein
MRKFVLFDRFKLGLLLEILIGPVCLMTLQISGTLGLINGFIFAGAALLVDIVYLFLAGIGIKELNKTPCVHARRFVADFTSHNRIVYASPPLAARATFWLGHYAALHSHAKTPPHFCSLGLCCAKPLFRLQKRRKQPERYAK